MGSALTVMEQNKLGALGLSVSHLLLLLLLLLRRRRRRRRRAVPCSPLVGFLIRQTRIGLGGLAGLRRVEDGAESQVTLDSLALFSIGTSVRFDARKAMALSAAVGQRVHEALVTGGTVMRKVRYTASQSMGGHRLCRASR